MRLEALSLTAICGVLLATSSIVADAFSAPRCHRRPFAVLGASRNAGAPATAGFIETELRGAAMKLHTKKQAPKEGEAKDSTPKEAQRHVTTRGDYLAFLVDSKHVFEALEEVVNEKPELAVFRNTGLERTVPLEKDIEFMVKEYGLTRPAVGKGGLEYAEEIRRTAREGSIPEFMCHFYNFNFAHTAGGRMIGKQMSSLLLDNLTLEFYKVRAAVTMLLYQLFKWGTNFL